MSTIAFSGYTSDASTHLQQRFAETYVLMAILVPVLGCDVSVDHHECEDYFGLVASGSGLWHMADTPAQHCSHHETIVHEQIFTDTTRIPSE